MHFVNSLDTGGVEVVLMNIIRKTHKNYNHEIIIKESTNIYEKELKQIGVKVTLAPEISQIKEHIRFMNDYIERKKNKIDLIHVHCGSLVYYLPMILAKKYSIPFIIHSHSSRNRSKLLSVIHKILRKINNSDHKAIKSYNIACSKEAGKWMFGDTDYQLLVNGLDLSTYRNSSEKNIEESIENLSNYIVIGHVGKFLEVKNQKFLLNFLKYLLINDNKNKYKLLLFGDGPLENELKEYSRKLGVSNNVTFVGFKPNIEDYYNLIDIIIFPSLYEGLPLTLIEAQTYGIPILVSDKVDNNIKINDNIEFFSLETKFDDIYNQFITLVSRGKVSNTLQGTEYDLNIMIDKIDRIYKNMVSNKKLY